jgi:hypothetical protein
MTIRAACLRLPRASLPLVVILGFCHCVEAQTVDRIPSVVTPAESLGVLSSRVMPFERIYVQTVNGEEIAGRFSLASSTSLTMEVDGYTREIAASDVRQVRRRGPNQVKRGMLVGYLSGVTLGLVGTMTSDSSDKGAGVFLSLTAAGGAGLIWGALIGAFIHERPVIYPLGSSSVQLTPLVGPSGASLVASVRF